MGALEGLNGNDSAKSSEERKGISWIENAHLVSSNKGKKELEDM